MLALGLLSGGLDSSLAVKHVMDQGVEVIALKFTSPFCQCDSGGKCHAADLANKFGIKLITVPVGEEYLEVVRNPKFGRGSEMNPCIDCRIFMLKRAKKIAEELSANFIFTGEVIGQRPMSQHRKALGIIEREAGLEGKLLRPLCAKLMPETEAEKMGWVDRSALLDISGRGRKTQIELAAEKGITDYPCPAGGCLLTSKEFSFKLKDFMNHNPDRLTMRDVTFLKVGRHFRIGHYKVIIGRNRMENATLRAFDVDGYSMLEPVLVPGPVGLVEGDDLACIEMAASIVARYADNNGSEIRIKLKREGENLLVAKPASPERIEQFRIGAPETSTATGNALQ